MRVRVPKPLPAPNSFLEMCGQLAKETFDRGK